MPLVNLSPRNDSVVSTKLDVLGLTHYESDLTHSLALIISVQMLLY